MRNFNSLLILFFLGFNLMGSTPAFPYSFFGPDFSQLLPFNFDELKEYKKLKIKEIEISYSKKHKTIYYFNKEGTLYQDQSFKNNKKTNSSKYEFNSKGFPTYIETNYDHGKLNFIDSFAYNKNGVINYYLSLIKNIKRRGITSIDTMWCFVSKPNSKSPYILKSTVSKRRIKVDKSNEVIKVIGNHRTDSVQFLTKDNELTILYWHKTCRDTSYRIGKKMHYTNGLIDTISVYDIAYFTKHITCQQTFQYNRQELLLRQNQKNDNGTKSFFTYYNNGLLSNLPKKIITLEKRKSKIMQFKYKFYGN